MDALNQFKLPSTVPQDLILIQDIIGELPAQPRTNGHGKDVKEEGDGSIASTNDDSDSEEEEVVNLVLEDDDVEDKASDASGPSRSMSESRSSPDSDSDESDTDTEPPEDEKISNKNRERDVGEEDDDFRDSGGVNAVVKTEHELTDYNVTIPDISEVNADEKLDAAGQIINISDNIVIVQGAAADGVARAHERVLDSDTLLVFEDRRVLGYIHETFGPTHQPLYQVRFSQAYPIDPDKVKISRAVFHVPQRSKFVFVNEIKNLKGSDASNAHDEEPGEEEMEFSDDEQEAEHKRRLKQKRLESRGQSLAPSSRHTTPTPSQMRDQDLTADLSYGSNPYDEYSPYNVDSSASQARAAPLPYDDPYLDTYEINFNQAISATMQPVEGASGTPSTSGDSQRGFHGRGRARGQASKFGRDSVGRGRGPRRDKPNRDRGRGRHRGTQDAARELQHHQHHTAHSDQEYDLRRPASPASMAIARATSQYAEDSGYASPANFSSTSVAASNDYWSYQQSYQATPSYQGNQAGYVYQQPYVQPHINPRFASAYGYQFGEFPSNHYGQYGSYGMDASSGRGEDRNGGWRDYSGSYNPSNT
ncbi:NAF1-domain-containing protein [Gloeophyllum trabeum ATCC 11539]|uniref:H/ACA ribonucleoprotein complex non-core subunit NAF1 n=1 Tax=Gloeophyllum trabeum (strain ATCC 11539 / FP-39264 / Madison 617) TaxID=670483 RepID=S7QKV1_GLOTA|nr:NAF1-domain-containing protein [Gloeophyllum trabeum ATCC 11539]EPQ60456.1 NAF1-domain-containing protein [Gloeophyllum trabeum ATCC 11539]